MLPPKQSMKPAMMSPLKLNLGCASRPLPGYINIDLDDVATMMRRYPNIQIPDLPIYQYDIFKLPYADGTVDEARADAFIEHLSFLEESKFFYEMKRILKPGGKLCFCVPDFEKAVEQWLKAKDDWKDFYRCDDEAIAQAHWFGNYSYTTENRWGYLTASIFGPQNSPGQFHKNAYTARKIRAIMKKLEFKEPSITPSRWKGDRDHMLDVVAEKA
ncbi:MAG: methyltransferase domain-containing protein [Bacteriovoracia bacterium]